MTENPNTYESAQPTNYVQRQDDDEISLIELWDILVRRKKIIAAVFAIVMVAALGYLAVAKPVFESRAIISVGFIPQNANLVDSRNVLNTDTKLVENPENLVREMKELYGVNAETKKTEEGILSLAVQELSPEKSREKLGSAIEKTVNELDTLYNEAISDITAYMDSLESQQTELENQIDEYKKGINLTSTKDASLSAMMILEKGNALEQKTDLEKQIAILRLALSPVNNQPTKILSGPTLPSTPVKPKQKLVLALSFVLGIFMGVFAAFFAEFLANAKKMRRERASQ